jgi:hypothetical protein
MFTLITQMLLIYGIYSVFRIILQLIRVITRNAPVISMRLARIGVYFHEFCHFIIAKLLGLPVTLDQITISGGEGRINIQPHDPAGLTLLQTMWLALAPLAGATIILSELWPVFLANLANVGMTIGLAVLMLAILVVAPPSGRDLQEIGSAIYHRTGVAIRQLLEIGSVMGLYSWIMPKIALGPQISPLWIDGGVISLLLGSMEVSLLGMKWVLRKAGVVIGEKISRIHPYRPEHKRKKAWNQSKDHEVPEIVGGWDHSWTPSNE